MSNFFDAMYSKPNKLSFVNPNNIDIFLCPKELVAWLNKAGEDAEGEYHEAVSSMCEYSCLWVCGKLKDKYKQGKLKGELYVCYGNFGFWEHYWIGYKMNGIEYFLDLTLAQFRKESPKLAITISEQAQGVAEYNNITKIPFDEFFGRLERDWNLIESGESFNKEMDFSKAMNDNVKSLMDKLNDLE